MLFEHKRYTFTDGEGVERVLRAQTLALAGEAAYAFVVKQTGSVAAGALASRSTKEADDAAT